MGGGGGGGWGGSLNLLKPKPHPLVLQCFKTFGPHDRFSTHHWINTGNKQITDNTYDESEIKT